jgi:hypothetical protein
MALRNWAAPVPRGSFSAKNIAGVAGLTDPSYFFRSLFKCVKIQLLNPQAPHGGSFQIDGRRMLRGVGVQGVAVFAGRFLGCISTPILCNDSGPKAYYSGEVYFSHEWTYCTNLRRVGTAGCKLLRRSDYCYEFFL